MGVLYDGRNVDRIRSGNRTMVAPLNYAFLIHANACSGVIYGSLPGDISLSFNKNNRNGVNRRVRLNVNAVTNKSISFSRNNFYKKKKTVVMNVPYIV
jgi:hypothetical protein